MDGSKHRIQDSLKVSLPTDCPMKVDKERPTKVFVKQKETITVRFKLGLLII